MRRVVALGVAVMLAIVVVRTVDADLENPGTDAPKVFTSKPDRLRLVVPHGWRASDQPSYPGLLLWMMRPQPEGRIVFTAEAFTHELYCSWPITCRTSHEINSMPAKFACALRAKLQAQRLRVGPVQAGPKENEEAGLASVWFEYDDGKHFLRQAVALGDDRAVSLVLSAPSSEARAANVRAFEQVLRTLRPLTTEEIGATQPLDAGVTVMQAPNDGPPADAGTISDASIGNLAGSAAFESAPAPKINPVGACTQQ